MKAGVLATTLLLTACVASPQPSPLQLIAQAPTAGTPLASQFVSAMPATVETMSVLNGAVALGTQQDGILVATAPGSTAFNPPTSLTGAVSAMALNQDGTLLVAGVRGLFVSSGSNLVTSPLATSIPSGLTITSLSSFGSGASEQLWFVTNGGLNFLSNNNVSTISLSGLGTPDVVIAMAPGQAIVVADGKLQTVDLNSSAVLTLVPGVGHAYAASRDSSGTAWIGVDAGLLSVDTSDNITLRTLAAPGAASTPVCGVFASAGTVYAGTPTALIQITTSKTQTVGTLQSPSGSCPVAVDGQGNIYVTDSAGLYEFAAPQTQQVSFATNVEPILNQYCTSCHTTGANNAPTIDFTQYSQASMYAQNGLLVTEIAPTYGRAAMPPLGSPQLSTADIQTIVDWVNQGEPQ